MTESERLTALVDDYTESISARELHEADFAEKFADHLLQNGVIVPPCRVGGVVWTTYKNEVAAATVIAIYIDRAGMLLDVRVSVPHGHGTDIVKDVDVAEVFLTEKDAEAARKEATA